MLVPPGMPDPRNLKIVEQDDSKLETNLTLESITADLKLDKDFDNAVKKDLSKAFGIDIKNISIESTDPVTKKVKVLIINLEPSKKKEISDAIDKNDDSLNIKNESVITITGIPPISARLDFLKYKFYLRLIFFSDRFINYGK